MRITEVRITLAADGDDRRGMLKAFASFVVNGELCVRDCKVIEADGRLVVAMPSRKIGDHCPGCGTKNHLLARFCNGCGIRLADKRAGREADGRPKLYADLAHPINPAGREDITRAVLDAYLDALDGRDAQAAAAPLRAALAS